MQSLDALFQTSDQNAGLWWTTRVELVEQADGSLTLLKRREERTLTPLGGYIYMPIYIYPYIYGYIYAHIYIYGWATGWLAGRRKHEAGSATMPFSLAQVVLIPVTQVITPSDAITL